MTEDIWKINASNDDTPLKRVETLEYHKKALSFFMPSSQEWDPKTKSGNPTKSRIISQFMNALKVKQVRNLGQPSRARRPLTQKEFCKIIGLLRLDESPEKCYGLPAYFLFQYHMMARVDDVSHMKLDNLKPHLDYSFVLLSKMNWSKNIYEERQTPDQILFGSMDAKNCVLLALAIHFETWFASDGLTSDFLCLGFHPTQRGKYMW